MLVSKSFSLTNLIKTVPLFNIYKKTYSILSRNLINYNQINRLTKPYNSYRFVRYTGNKTGHARKVMEILNKNKPPINNNLNQVSPRPVYRTVNRQSNSSIYEKNKEPWQQDYPITQWGNQNKYGFIGLPSTRPVHIYHPCPTVQHNSQKTSLPSVASSNVDDLVSNSNSKPDPVPSPKTSIPVAPPLPNNKAVIPIKNPSKPSAPITKELLEKTKENLKKTQGPKALSETELHQYNQKTNTPFKSIVNQKPYLPIISENTKTSDLSDQAVKQFLLERGLTIKNDKPIDGIDVLIKPKGSFVLGINIHETKLTQFGNSYLKKVIDHKNHEISKEFVPSIINPETDGDIVIIKSSGLPSIVTTGGLTHLLHGYRFENYYYICGMYTSKKTNTVLSSTQYTDYQDQKELSVQDNDIKNSKKTQYFQETNCLQKIHKDHVIVPKWSKEYVTFIKEQELFIELFEKKKSLPCVAFNNTGVTKDDAIVMCKDFDYNLAKAQKHPTTLDQEISQEQINQKKLNLSSKEKHES